MTIGIGTLKLISIRSRSVIAKLNSRSTNCATTCSLHRGSQAFTTPSDITRRSVSLASHRIIGSSREVLSDWFSHTSFCGISIAVSTAHWVVKATLLVSFGTESRSHTII